MVQELAMQKIVNTHTRSVFVESCDSGWRYMSVGQQLYFRLKYFFKLLEELALNFPQNHNYSVNLLTFHLALFTGQTFNLSNNLVYKTFLVFCVSTRGHTKTKTDLYARKTAAC